jgi:hypothetical protein
VTVFLNPENLGHSHCFNPVLKFFVRNVFHLVSHFSSLSFESNSRLTRIESFAFPYSSLQSIVIPRTVRSHDDSRFSDMNFRSILALTRLSNRRRLQGEFTKRPGLCHSPYLVETVVVYDFSARPSSKSSYAARQYIRQSFERTRRLAADQSHWACAVHEAEWMQLDILPEKILRTADYFKLANFGTLTKVGGFVEGCDGARPSVSPEALAAPFGSRPVTGQTDISASGPSY